MVVHMIMNVKLVVRSCQYVCVIREMSLTLRVDIAHHQVLVESIHSRLQSFQMILILSR